MVIKATSSRNKLNCTAFWHLFLMQEHANSQLAHVLFTLALIVVYSLGLAVRVPALCAHAQKNEWSLTSSNPYPHYNFAFSKRILILKPFNQDFYKLHMILHKDKARNAVFYAQLTMQRQTSLEVSVFFSDWLFRVECKDRIYFWIDFDNRCMRDYSQVIFYVLHFHFCFTYPICVTFSFSRPCEHLLLECIVPS